MPIVSSPQQQQQQNKTKLHPCLRAYNGKCNFGRKCRFATLPYDCCLSFLKGNCKDPNCKHPHHNTSSSAECAKQQQQLHTNDDDEKNWEIKEITDLMMLGDINNNNNNQQTPTSAAAAVAVPSASSSKTDEFQKQLQEMKNSRDSLIAEKKKLQAKFKQSNDELRKQLESRLAAEVDKNAKLQREVEELKHQLQVQQSSARLFDEHLLASKKMIASADELKSLREKMNLEALSLCRMPLLSKVFDIAAARLASVKNPNYPTLTRSECLFSEVAPVASAFFKACPAHVFAQVIDPATGDLNKKHFDIVFHGTRGAVAAALSIQCTGFDPKRRAGQACGRGEYCASAENPQNGFATASGYSGGAILAALIYIPDKDTPRTNPQNHGAAEIFGPVSKFANGIYVIDNPLDGSCTFMLPLGCAYEKNQTAHSLKSNPNLFLRTCACAQAQARKAFEEYKKKESSDSSLAPLTSSEFNGKRLYYYNSASGNNTKQQADAFNTRYLLNILYNKNNNNASSSRKIYYTIIRDHENNNEEVEVSVDLSRFAMTGIKSGKIFNMVVM